MGTFTFILVGLISKRLCEAGPVSGNTLRTIVEAIPLYFNDDLLSSIFGNFSDPEVLQNMKEFNVKMNSTFNHSHISFIQKTLENAEAEPKFEAPSGNPQCDIGIEGPRTVKRVIPGQLSNNPFNNIPSFNFDLTKTTEDLLNKATSVGGANTASSSVAGMIGMMFVKNMVQSTAATATAIIPQGIPPPVWNLRPLPCLPMVTGSNCFGAVMYPITFSDSMLADVTDSVLTSIIKQFRSTFKERAGLQPDSVYQKCFKAYMSMMCSSIFPMCTNIQGQNEFIPLLGRVPMCFTNCIGVLATCPGFTLTDIEGPCAEVSLPPLCSQAIYMKDDPIGQRTVEDEVAENINSKCHNYDPEIDAGQDPYLYEEEPVEKLFHDQHEMQAYMR
jgi:hypothetical protein